MTKKCCVCGKPIDSKRYVKYGYTCSFLCSEVRSRVQETARFDRYLAQYRKGYRFVLVEGNLIWQSKKLWRLHPKLLVNTKVLFENGSTNTKNTQV